MIDIRTDIRAAFERQQSAFPPPAALRAQVVAAVNSRTRAATPARRRADWDLRWLMLAAAVLLTIAIVGGLMAVRLMNSHPTLVKPGPAPQLCIRGTADRSDLFARIHGCITYSDGTEIVAVDPYHPANRIVLGPSNGQLPIAWSRDGSRLLLMTMSDLYVMNADGSEVRLTHGDATNASFSPDGTKVVYARFGTKVVPGFPDESTEGLYVIDARGGTPQKIADGYICSVGSCKQSSSVLEYPAWSPAGSGIAYAEYRGDLGKDEIWSMNSDGTGKLLLVDLGPCEGQPASGCTVGLAWSPDGSHLAFHTDGGIYTVRADGSGLHRISPLNAIVAWSPDGKRLAFSRGGELFTMASDGSNVTLVASVVVAPPYGWAWNPEG